MAEPQTAPILIPRLETRDALLIAGLQRHYTLENLKNISAQWQTLPFGKIPGQAGRAAYGVIFNSASNGCDFDYLSGVEVAGTVALPAEVTRIKLPSQRYAIFPHHGHASRLKETIAAIFQQWVPVSNHLLDPAQPRAADLIEYYGEDFDPQTGTGDMEVWLPIKA